MTLADLAAAGFDVDVKNHALAILIKDFPGPLQELCTTLLHIKIPCSELIKGGGGEAQSTQRLRRALTERGWAKRKIVIRKVVDEHERASTTHEVDHVRQDTEGAIALEIEWNNKDPFFDRDLENFQRLHAEGAISVGVIVTRGASLQGNMRSIIRRCADIHGLQSFDDLDQFGITLTPRQRGIIQSSAESTFVDAWTNMMVADKFGSATTHWDKLRVRLLRGVGNPCPLVLIGIPDSVVAMEP